MLKRSCLSLLLLAVPAWSLRADEGPANCDELKKSAARTEYAITTSQDMMQSDPKMNTPDMRAAVETMKKKLAEKKAKLKAMGCSDAGPVDFMDMTKDRTFSSPCEKAKAEIKATTAYIAAEEGMLSNPPPGTPPGEIRRCQDTKALAEQHLKYQKALLAENHCP